MFYYWAVSPLSRNDHANTTALVGKLDRGCPFVHVPMKLLPPHFGDASLGSLWGSSEASVCVEERSRVGDRLCFFLRFLKQSAPLRI